MPMLLAFECESHHKVFDNVRNQQGIEGGNGKQHLTDHQ